MIVLIFILYVIIRLSIEANEDAKHRSHNAAKGYDTYWSNDGLRYTKDNKKVYK